MANRATSENGFDESLGVTPIPRSNSSPSILKNPIQVVSPNLAAGSASSASHPLRDPDIDASTAQAILQQWAEVKTEDGTVERTYSQCAQTWPLASHVKLDNIESAIHILRQACDYLYNGLSEVGSVVDQKCNTEKVQQAMGELVAQIQRMQATLEIQQHQLSSRELQAAAGQLREDIRGLTQGFAEVQMDILSRDQRISELEEVIFQAGVTMEMVCRSAVRAFSRFEFPRRDR